MLIFHVKHAKRKILALTAAAVAVVVCVVFLLPGCLDKGAVPSEPINAPTTAQQVAYLEQLGWQVSDEPLETLELQLNLLL